MIINKWFFQGFKESVKNEFFHKTIPFCAFSDLDYPQYDLIESFMDSIGYNKDLVLSIGETKAPFGHTLYPDNPSDMNTLLNSCEVSFVFSNKIRDTNYLLKSVLAGIIPICNSEHLYVKKLGLERFSIIPNLENLHEKMSFIKKKSYINSYYIWSLSQKYLRQCKKW